MRSVLNSLLARDLILLSVYEIEILAHSQSVFNSSRVEDDLTGKAAPSHQLLQTMELKEAARCTSFL